MTSRTVTIGVLALQGSFSEHLSVLTQLSPLLSPLITLHTLAVRTATQLSQCDGLILPGGESTAISYLIRTDVSGLGEALRAFVAAARRGEGKACWGTCAGMILLAEEVVEAKEGYEGLGGIGVRVVRNQWGRQSESFQHALSIPCLSSLASSPAPSLPLQAIFIRAPVIHTLLPASLSSITVLSRIPREIIPEPKSSISAFTGQEIPALEVGPDADVVMCREGDVLVSSFHPELLGGDLRVHEWWIREMILKEF